MTTNHEENIRIWNTKKTSIEIELAALTLKAQEMAYEIAIAKAKKDRVSQESLRLGAEVLSANIEHRQKAISALNNAMAKAHKEMVSGHITVISRNAAKGTAQIVIRKNGQSFTRHVHIDRNGRITGRAVTAGLGIVEYPALQPGASQGAALAA